MIDYDVISQAIKECETIEDLNRIVNGLSDKEKMRMAGHINATKRRINMIKEIEGKVSL
jgi:hypothetical protein